jgi:hypothetical protein
MLLQMVKGNDMLAARSARAEKTKVRQAKVEKMKAVAVNARSERGVAKAKPVKAAATTRM